MIQNFFRSQPPLHHSPAAETLLTIPTASTQTRTTVLNKSAATVIRFGVAFALCKASVGTPVSSAAIAKLASVQPWNGAVSGCITLRGSTRNFCRRRCCRMRRCQAVAVRADLRPFSSTVTSQTARSFKTEEKVDDKHKKDQDNRLVFDCLAIVVTTNYPPPPKKKKKMHTLAQTKQAVYFCFVFFCFLVVETHTAVIFFSLFIIRCLTTFWFLYVILLRPKWGW